MDRSLGLDARRQDSAGARVIIVQEPTGFLEHAQARETSIEYITIIRTVRTLAELEYCQFSMIMRNCGN